MPSGCRKGCWKTHPIWPQVVAGQTAALALKKVKRTAVRKGMVLVDEKLRPHACWEFNAEIAILTHSTTIQPRYQVGRLAADTGHGMVFSHR
jgi:GTPase